MSVYIAQAKDGGPVKVGHSFHFKTRQTALDALFPYGVELMAQIDGDYVTEFFLHHCFEPVRIRGEWYRNSMPIWRTLADIEDNGRPNWLPPDDCAEVDFKALALDHFGSSKAAMAACGYSPATNFSDVIGTSSRGGRGGGRLMFTIAVKQGRLPAYLKHPQSAAAGGVGFEAFVPAPSKMEKAP